jgi:hypothetical protein
MASSTTSTSVPNTLILEESATTVTTTKSPTVAVMVGTSAQELSERMHQRIDLNDITTNNGVAVIQSSNFPSSNTTTTTKVKETSHPKRM